MRRTQLINRWYSDEGSILLSNVLKAFAKGRKLETVLNLNKHENRWDLRGAPLCYIVDQQKLGNSKHQINFVTGSFNVKNYAFSDIDFTYADISHSVLQECRIDNCLFLRSRAREIAIYNCDFNMCHFESVEFSYSFMNSNVGKRAGSYLSCKFIKSKLNECVFTFPIIDNCLFEDCNLYATNFDGARIRNTKFVGKVNSCWFRGYSKAATTSILWLFNRVNPHNFPNLMDNVDFIDADLYGVSFMNGINLDKCKFPKDDNLLLIKNIKSIYSMAVGRIEKEWVGDSKRVGLNLIDSIFFNKDKQEQDADVIDKKILKDHDGLGFRFFDLMSDLVN